MIFHRRKKRTTKKPVEKSDFIKFVETSSTIPPTGKVVITANGKKITVDYFAPKPTPEILKKFIEMLKLKNVTDYRYE